MGHNKATLFTLLTLTKSIKYSSKPACIKVVSKTLGSGLGLKVFTTLVFPILVVVKVGVVKDLRGCS